MNKILCISLFLAFAAYGQQQEHIAVMHMVDNLDSIGVTDLGYLTDKLRDIAGQILPQETIKVEFYSVQSGTLLGTVTGDSKDLRSLLAVLESKAPKLFEDMPDVSPAVPEKPVPPPLPDSAFVLPVAPAATDSPAVPLKLDPFAFSAQESVPAAAPAAPKECANKFNINELVSKIESSFSGQLRDCSAALAKNIALAMSPFGKKTEQKEPKAFMTECVIDGIKRKLPVGAEEYMKPIEGFVRNLLNAAAAAGGGLDVKKLPGVIGGMNVNGLIDDLKNKATGDPCAVDEPRELPVVPVVPGGKEKEEEEGAEKKEGRKVFSLGLRGGFNFSHVYATYSNDSYNGSGTYGSRGYGQIGLVFDWALIDQLHIQPGLMLIGKGTSSYDDDFAYIEIPLLFSLKFSVLRVNAGTYFGIDVYNNSRLNIDYYNEFGLSTGFGFDIEKIYIGMFYDYGLTKAYRYRYNDSRLKAYNRTLGFNLGVNL